MLSKLFLFTSMAVHKLLSKPILIIELKYDLKKKKKNNFKWYKENHFPFNIAMHVLSNKIGTVILNATKVAYTQWRQVPPKKLKSRSFQI